MACERKIVHFGMFSTDDPDYDGFYLVQWMGTPYKSQEDLYVCKYNPPIFVKEGEMLVKAKYLDKVPWALGWWMAVNQSVTVQVQQIHISNVEMVEPSVAHQL